MADPKDILLNNEILLEQAAENFGIGNLSPVAYSAKRETIIATMLQAMAHDCGIKLKEPLHLDSNGEFSIVVVHPDLDERVACGQFGERFAKWLSTIAYRTGEHYTRAPILPENGWCRLNHFEAERLVRAYSESLIFEGIDLRRAEDLADSNLSRAPIERPGQ